MNKDRKKIILVGGGTGGSVSPLLAVAKIYQKKYSNADFLFIGGKNGVEAKMAEEAGIQFIGIASAKLRRYFSLLNFFIPFILVKAFFEALSLIKKEKPSLIFGAGSFVQVPVAYAAKVAHVPVVLHQQDVVPSLSNTLCSFLAERITVSLSSSVKDFSQGMFIKSLEKESKVIVAGNPYREEILSGNKKQALARFELDDTYPTIVFFGGATGAKYINELVSKNIAKLTENFNVLHITGAAKKNAPQSLRYHPHEFISEMDLVYAVSDIVVARAGMSTLTELAVLEKIAIIIPMPESHQERNAAVFGKLPAALVLEQKEIIPERFPVILKNFLFDDKLHQVYKENLRKIMPKDGGEKIAEIIHRTIEKSS